VSSVYCLQGLQGACVQSEDICDQVSSTFTKEFWSQGCLGTGCLVIPEDVFASFKPPVHVAEAGYDEITVFADCSSVDAVELLFEKLDFIDKPVTFFDALSTAQRARLS
jgi:hypothetical protein